MSAQRVERRIRIGLLGCGVVGAGVVWAVEQSKHRVACRTGVELEVVRIAVRDVDRARPQHVDPLLLTANWKDVVTASDVDVVVEAMGGLSPAEDAISLALRSGKHVVTANKQLLAARGEVLSELATSTGRALLFDAAVGAAIPVLHVLDSYYGANHIFGLRGIVNGTSNYILTQMDHDGLSFAQALAEAQAAGYAEADPTADVDGWDALAKLQVLTRTAFGLSVPADAVARSGIASVRREDLALAAELGWKLKHVVEVILQGGPIRARVGLALVAPSDLLYGIDGVHNGLVVSSDLAGDLLFAGAGAGAEPTASAIVEDVLKAVEQVGGATRAATASTLGTTRPMGAGSVQTVKFTEPTARAVVVTLQTSGNNRFGGRAGAELLYHKLAAQPGLLVEQVQPIATTHAQAAWVVTGELVPTVVQQVAQALWHVPASGYPVYGTVLPLDGAAAFCEPVRLPSGLS
ncbi:homoserine dehydrogenase [Alicyclobacillus sp. ALC3]|uniref:homoserine dehydrogenase n=1 Tax=Alicyclobacillus sp. ALC3 TaxID=2796143 RepID=UPI002379E837|nr:homoserine dehydrogenase [Alicyclobacillus sp. ALC3]WDL98228.1 homoserine dehydrogenase [Alicyclobacillus sp. ALC3]